MSKELKKRLSDFTSANKFSTKGKLCVALVVTDHARKKEMPLVPNELLTKSGGQVQGLGKTAVQKILGRHEIKKVLAQEGGRTSRGSIDNMQKYVDFLNQLEKDEILNLEEVESYWIEQVRKYFASKPFKINLDQSISLRAVIADLIVQVKKRQEQAPHIQTMGAVLQHLVGAKLETVFPEGKKLKHHSYSTSDAQTARPGDFFLGDSSIHVTTAPSEALIKKCKRNLEQNLNPIIVTLDEKVQVAFGLAENQRLYERIEVFSIEQFLAVNIYELGKFEKKGKTSSIKKLIKAYNKVIDEYETDPSLRIEPK